MVTGGLTTRDGLEWYRIDAVEQMEPFLTTVVSDSDLWMFVSSTGALTAGRVDADHSIFPYTTDDKIHQAVGRTGPVTIIARSDGAIRDLWRPFHDEVTPGCTRSLAKSVVGDRLAFEEYHTEWGVRFRATWSPSAKYGWVRTVELIDEGGNDADFEVLDGILDVMPAGVDALTEQIRSNLVDAYKRSETGPWGSLAIYNMESLITDKAEPAEALAATTVWSYGFERAAVHLDRRAIAPMLAGRPLDPPPLVTGRAGAYLLRGPVTLSAGGSTTWAIVADTGLGHAEVSATAAAAADPASPAAVGNDIDEGSRRLHGLLADADAFQATADPLADAHHLSNVLFNSMRGGVFPFGHAVPVEDFAAFVESRNREAAERNRSWLESLEPGITITNLRAIADERGDADLARLVLEYLPLTFSRRHGDPSRPWNKFAIHVRDDDGDQVLAYEGNWRDIFQNWEALLLAYPAYFTNVVATFVNASTFDGYNPYRISQAGIDWEVPDENDPWSNIGYWGDHQIVYLLRLLEAWERHEPGAIGAWFDEQMFVYGDVPYDLSGPDEMFRDPRDTVTFDDRHADAIDRRVEHLGADGKLVVDGDGSLLRVGFAEKLLVPALAKLSNYVPGGGIWMNTQRPEWNDANNALAGPGLSVVTLLHLRRYLSFVGDLLDDRHTLTLTSTVAGWVSDVAAALDRSPSGIDDRRRRSMLHDLLVAADAHRQRAQAHAALDRVEVPADEVSRLLAVAIEHLDATIAVNRRADGLYHSYNLVSFPTDSEASIAHLQVMLEGQVAALSSGALAPAEAVALVDALFASDLHRADLDSFLLYPAVELPRFLDRNVADTDVLADDAALRLQRVFERDHHGRLRFRPEATNAAAVDQLLADVGASEADRASVHAVYESLFDHASFTGRSGSMYGYEGLGSIYWHMVAKLLLAVQENYLAAVADGNRDAADALAGAYRRIRSGLGFRKAPEVFGAFPTDCYSHSPAHAGAQQPGMTGQVKEEVIARFGELGIHVGRGRIALRPGLLPRSEILPDGPAGARFTYCSVPMTVREGPIDRVTVTMEDGTSTTRDGSVLTTDESRSVFARDGAIERVEWMVAALDE